GRRAACASWAEAGGRDDPWARLRLLALAAERHLQGTFLGAAHELQLDGAALRRLERVEQVIGGAYRLARGRHDQVALSETGPGRPAVLGHVPGERPPG